MFSFFSSIGKFFGLSIVLLFLVGCAKYNPKDLNVPNGNFKEKSNVLVAKKVLSEDECRKCFGNRIIKRGFQPIQICVKNKTANKYILDPDNIGLQIENPKNVASRLHRDPMWKGAKYYLLTGPIWGLVDGVRSNNVNKKIDSDFDQRSISDSRIEKIKPYGIINKVIFVKKDNYEEKFNLKLINRSSNKELNFVL